MSIGMHFCYNFTCNGKQYDMSPCKNDSFNHSSHACNMILNRKIIIYLNKNLNNNTSFFSTTYFTQTLTLKLTHITLFNMTRDL